MALRPRNQISFFFLLPLARQRDKFTFFLNSSAVFFLVSDLDWQWARKQSVFAMKRKQRKKLLHECVRSKTERRVLFYYSWITAAALPHIGSHQFLALVSFFSVCPPFVSCSILPVSCLTLSIPGLLPRTLPLSSRVSGSDNFRASLNFSSFVFSSPAGRYSEGKKEN